MNEGGRPLLFLIMAVLDAAIYRAMVLVQMGCRPTHDVERVV
jgi:hypothetical protein